MSTRTRMSAESFLLVISLLVLPACTITCKAADPLPLTTERISKSVVLVISRSGPDGESIGTGFCIRNDGYILTARHLVQNSNVSVGIPTKDGKSVIPAVYVGGDETSDLAILKVNSRIPALSFAPGRRVPGESVAITGFPFGSAIDGRFVPSTFSGIVSCIRKKIPEAEYDWYQLDFPVEKGGSGAPLFLPRTGEVVGIVTTHLIPADHANGTYPVGIAVSAEAARNLAHRCIPSK